MEAPLRTLAEQVDPEVAALLVIDMQNDFCHPKGVSGMRGRQITMTIEMAPRLESFINACRGARLPVIFVQTIHYPWTDSPSWLRRLDKDRGDSVCRPGTWGAEFYGGIKPLEGEIVITKHRYSAFHGTDLDLILRSRGIRSLLISGVGTNVCVESTLRDGYMRDYYIVLLEDCVGATNQQLHQATLKNVDLHFGSVTNSTQISGLWNKL
ncbi:MAG TPA: cysteine hydrolase [Candidatus Binatia bacterium]|jgi:ureidoacrylate peracid hydrolase